MDSNFKIPGSHNNALVDAIKGGSAEIVKMLVDDPNTNLDVKEYGRPVLDLVSTHSKAQKLRGSDAIKSLIEEGQRCRQIAANKHFEQFIPEANNPNFIDPKLSIDDPQHQRQINVNMLGFGQAALFLVGAGLLVKYFMGKGNQKPSATVDAESAKKMSDEKSNDKHDKSH